MPVINFDYDHVPTVGQFAASDAFIRGLMGPFGSGKSSGCVMEFPSRGQEQARGPDGKRRTRWSVVRNCFDDQTEILTETRGWQLFRNLLPADRVAMLKDGEELVWERPSFYYSAHYKGEMIGLKSDGIDVLVTPDHRLWTSKRKTRQQVWAPHAHEKAAAAYGRELRRFKRDAVWRGGNARYSDDFYEFLGFWFAEGYAGAYQYKDRHEPHYRFVVVQKNPTYPRNLLARAGLKWSEHLSKESGCTYFRIRITDDLKPLIRELAALGHAPSKYLPSWLKDCPATHAMAFLTGYWRGDGTKRTGVHHSTRGNTASPRLADDLQEMALRAGMVANVARHNTRRLTSFINGKAVTGTQDFMMSVCFLSGARSEPRARGWYKVDYDAMVYCVEVSSHVVYVRRGGKGHWSGQTNKMLEDTTIKTFFQWLPPAYFGRYTSNDHRYVIKAFPECEIEILFRALDRPDHIKNLLSLDLTGGWVNEAREVPWALIEAMMGRVGRYPSKMDGGCTWSGIWLDTNPPEVDSKWYKFFEEESWRDDFNELKLAGKLPPGIVDPDDYAHIFKQPAGTDPNAENLPNLQAGYYQRLGIGKTDEWKKVYILGQYGFVTDNKTVFPEYRDSLHLLSAKDLEEGKGDPIPGVTVEVNLDFGLTPACTFSQMQPNGRWLIFAELIAEEMGIDRFSDNLLAYCAKAFKSRNGQKVNFSYIADPAGEGRAQTDERTCFEILQGKGIDVYGGEQNLQMRLESLRKPMLILGDYGGPRIAIHPRCTQTRKAFMGAYYYRRMATNSERYSTEPEKNHPYSDLMDGLEYRAVEHFGHLVVRDMPQEGPPQRQRDNAGRSKVTGY